MAEYLLLLRLNDQSNAGRGSTKEATKAISSYSIRSDFVTKMVSV